MKKIIVCKEKKINREDPYPMLDTLYFVVAYDDYSVKESAAYNCYKEKLAYVIDGTFTYESLDDALELEIYFESNMTTDQELRDEIIKIGFTNLTLNIKTLDEAPDKQIVKRVRAKIKEKEEKREPFIFMDTFRGSRRLYEERILG